MGNLATFKSAWADERDAMRRAYAKYSDTVAKLEQHKGSKYGEEQIEAARATYEADMDKARSTYGGRMGETLKAMKAAMERREKEQAAKVPTDEQLRMLQAVALRSSITMAEYQTYQDAMYGCDMASKALHDLAAERMPEGTNLEPSRTIQSSAWEQCKELSNQARTLARWDGGTQRGEALAAHLEATRDKGGEGHNLSLNNIPTDTSKAFHSAAVADIDPTSPDFYKHVLGMLLYDQTALELLD